MTKTSSPNTGSEVQARSQTETRAGARAETRARPAGRHPAVVELLGSGDSDEAAIESPRFCEHVGSFIAGNAFPLVAPGQATFAWLGVADQVELVRWIHAGVDRIAFERVGDTRLWLLALPVEDGGRFEYKLSIARNGEENWTVDPLNDATAEDPFGPNSVCLTHGYTRPAWSLSQNAPGGHIEQLRVESDAFAQVREERVYVPAGYDTGLRYPLLIVHDGDDFVDYASLTTCLDNLIAMGDIPPLVAALVQTRERMEEYPRGRRHARYVVLELLPALEASYSITGHAHERVLLGASLGAVASLATAFRFPGIFGGLFLASGSFVLDERILEGRRHPVFLRVARLVKALRRAPTLPATRAYVSTGELEGLASENRALADFLGERGVEVRFDLAWDGHHWHNWRDRLRDGLMWAFGASRKGT